MRQHIGYLPQGPVQDEPPISRTYQYRKVMKPMLERKRRARINRCLDELKELMVCALQAEGENVSKLEKADILELTVRHLHKLKSESLLDSDRFKAGFSRCTSEVSKFLTCGQKDIDQESGTKLLHHLGSCIQHIEDTPKDCHPYTTPPASPHQSYIAQSIWRPW